MAEVVRKLKVNRRYEATACGWCGDALALGEDGAVCEACETPHHARCWDEKAGCGQHICVNAPLRLIGVRAQEERQPEPDEKWCPYCGKIIYSELDICPFCNEVVSADGLYHGERRIPYGAKVALVLSIVGFFALVFFPLGLMLGGGAFVEGSKSAKRITADAKLRGRQLAVAAQWIGASDLVLAFLVLVLSQR